jgi:flagellin-like hook-associated protein FlgL
MPTKKPRKGELKMAINDVSLTAGMRSNLLSLQDTVNLLNRTQNRLSTGKKVNSAIDNPVSFFAAQSLNSRASVIDSLKDSMGQAVQTISAADKGIKALTAMIQQAKGIAQSAQSASGTELTDLKTQYNALLDQMDELAEDAGYRGKNLLSEDDLVVKFEGAALTVAGFDASASAGLGLVDAEWSSTVSSDANITALDAALEELRVESSKMSGNLSIISVRQEFSKDMINVLSEGSDKLTLADTNEEGANMLMLQTRQSLSTTALSLSAQAAQSVLRLFG